MVVKVVQFRRWTVYADVIATREAFSLVQKGGSEECSCAYCRNFLVVRHQVYPAEVLAFELNLWLSYPGYSKMKRNLHKANISNAKSFQLLLTATRSRSNTYLQQTEKRCSVVIYKLFAITKLSYYWHISRKIEDVIHSCCPIL